jgi:hypothetical protein
MRTLVRLASAGALAMLLSPAGVVAQITAQQQAFMAIVGLDINSEEIVRYCESGASSATPSLRSAWQAWRARNRIDDVTGRLDDTILRRTRDAMASTVAATRQKLASAGQPAAVCGQLGSMWSGPDFDPRRSYPAAYDASGNVVAVPVASAAVASTQRSAATTPTAAASTSASPSRRAFNPANYASVARPSGTVYSVAQLTPLVAGWFGTPRSYDRARAHVREAGTLYIRGMVITRRDSRFLETSDGTFASRFLVSPGIDVSAFDGQEITVEGTIDEVPSTILFLRNARVVRDASGLRASPLPAEDGMRRLEVTVDRITAVAGRGLRAQDIRGMFYTAYGATGVSGYEFREEMRLLLRDGWAYLRTDIAPADLDVEVSRRVEPQQWARWRAVSGGYEIQRLNDHGAPDGEWFRKTGRLLSVWPTNHRLNGSFTAAAFYGSIALGGTYSKTTYVFRPDGRWERVGYSQSSSGSMAAQSPVDFTASASSVSDGSGTKSSSGGGNLDVYTSGSSRRDDGAKNRGTYRLDGMTIEMRADDGTVTRTLCLPVDAKFESLYLFGRSFSRK